MKIVFMGTPDFAVVSLKTLLECGHDVVTVVTVPDKPKGRGRQVHASAVKMEAQQRNIPILQPESLKDASFIDQLKQLEADLFVVVAFRILPPSVFTIPLLGTVNVHASLLPKYRGAAPINWAIINGDQESGVTTMLIDEKVDTGNMLFQKSVTIDNNTNAGQLHDKLAVVGAELLIETIAGLSDGSVKPVKQDESQVSKAPKIFKEMTKIDFNQSANKVHNFIRGLSPYPTAFCLLGDKPFKIYQSEVSTEQGNAGQIISISKTDFTVACGTDAVKIKEVQLAGKKRMTVREFFNGYTLSTGQSLD